MPAERRRKVLVIPSWYPAPTRPANGVFVQEQARALATRYDVAVLAPWLATWWRREPHDAEPKTQEAWNEGVLERRERVRVPLPRWPAGLAWRYDAAINRGLSGLRDSWGTPDIIHAHVVRPAGAAAVRLGRRLNVPVVLTEHSEPFDIHLRTRGQRADARRTLLGAAQVVAVSPSLETSIRQFCLEVRCTVIGNVIDTDFFRPAPESAVRPRSEPVQFLFIGFLEERKGGQFLVEAAHLLLQRGISQFQITFGGDGPCRQALESMAARLGVAQLCRFVGLLDRDAVRDGIRRADVLVLPSQGETFGVVLAEAMACGVPVISTRCGGPEYVVTPDAGVLIPVADVAALANSMEGFIHGRHQFDPRAVRDSIVARFSREAFLERVSAVYEEVLRRPHAPAPR